MNNLCSEEFIAILKQMSVVYGIGCCVFFSMLIVGIIQIVKGNKKSSVSLERSGVRTLIISTIALLVTFIGSLVFGGLADQLALQIGVRV